MAIYKEENDDFRSYVRKLEHKSEKYEQMQYYVNGHENDKSKLITKMEDMKVKFEKQWNNLQAKNEDLQHLLGTTQWFKIRKIRTFCLKGFEKFFPKNVHFSLSGNRATTRIVFVLFFPFLIPL